MTEAQRALFRAFVAPPVGLSVAHAWRTYGSTVNLGFGALTPRVDRRGLPSQPDGEMGSMVEWSWRIEGRRSILCGSWSEEERWPRALACLTKATVAGASTFGRLPQIDMTLSTGVHVVSLMTAEGGPSWTLFDRRGERCRWLHVARGLLRVEEAVA